MRKLHVFNHVSLDGYFTDARSDMSWAHKQDDEWREFTSSNASGDAEMIFGRVTYQMMTAFWPTPQAAETLPDVARTMNAARKTVFSRTLDSVSWQNTTRPGRGRAGDEAAAGTGHHRSRQREHRVAADRRASD
jgi:dihydrofolate reductase